MIILFFTSTNRRGFPDTLRNYEQKFEFRAFFRNKYWINFVEISIGIIFFVSVDSDIFIIQLYRFIILNVRSHYQGRPNFKCISKGR